MPKHEQRQRHTQPTCPVGRLLDDQRIRLGLGSMEVIREINKRGKLTYTHTSWPKWMTGTIPRSDARRLLGDLLEIPHTTFAKVVAEQERERDGVSATGPSQATEASVQYADAVPFAGGLASQLDDYMKRRTFNRFLVLAGSAALFRPDVLATIFDGSSGVDDALADRLHERSLLYMRQWDQLPPHVLLTVVTGHLEEIRTAADCCRSPQLTRRLHAIASETAAFAGMLGWFTQDRGVAEIGLSRADEHAETIGHGPVHAVVLTIRADFHSHVQLGRHIGSAISRAMLDAAEEAIGDSPSPVRAWILLRQAEEFAVIGREADSDHCLDLADATLAVMKAAPDGMFSHWGQDMHRAFRGNCAQLIGNYRQSFDILSPLLRELDSGAVSNRISLQTDVAAVLARQGEPEQASSLLSESLAIANKVGLRERVKRIVGVRGGPLERYRRHTAVRRLDDQIKSLPAVTPSIPR